jgi:hypothetical protein
MAGRDHRGEDFSIAAQRAAMENYSEANAAEMTIRGKFE